MLDAARFMLNSTVWFAQQVIGQSLFQSFPVCLRFANLPPTIVRTEPARYFLLGLLTYVATFIWMVLDIEFIMFTLRVLVRLVFAMVFRVILPWQFRWRAEFHLLAIQHLDL